MGKVIAFPAHRIAQPAPPTVAAPAVVPAPTPAKYETVTDTAKLIRQALKTAFPGVKFSVRSESFSLGSSVNISWTDGPTEKRVEDVVNTYESVHRCEITGEILSGGNRYIECSRNYSDAMRSKAKDLVPTLPLDHSAYRYPEWDGSPNLHVVLAEMEG